MRIHWKAAALLITVPLLLAACAGRRTADEQRTEEQRERPGVEDSGSADAQKEPLRPTDEAPRYTVVASIGSCAPQADGVRNVGACCNDKPCHGQCVIEPGSKDVQCSCFGIRGGCPEGQVCCKRTRGCAKLEECDWIP